MKWKKCSIFKKKKKLDAEKISRTHLGSADSQVLSKHHSLERWKTFPFAFPPIQHFQRNGSNHKFLIKKYQAAHAAALSWLQLATSRSILPPPFSFVR